MKTLPALVLYLALAVSMPASFVKAESGPAPQMSPIEVARSLSQVFEEAATSIIPSVVNVSTTVRLKPGQGDALNGELLEQFKVLFGESIPNLPPPGQGPARESLGSGVIIDSEGRILTNYHVIGDADDVRVRTKDGEEHKAQVVGKDPRSDLAVIQIKAPNLPPARLGNSDDLKLGEWVVAVGTPFGLENSITAGIVSAKGRAIEGGGQYEDFIQTDAAINLGNSGGPLVNLQGEVVGINTAIFSRSGGYMGIGFAIPSAMARQVMKSLIEHGRVIRGWLGIGIQPLTEDLAKSFGFTGTEGVLIGSVEKGGPADKGGLKQGDIVTALNKEKIPNLNRLRNAVAAAEPGNTIDLEISREGEKKTLKVTPAEMPASHVGPGEEEATGGVAQSLGMIVEDLRPELSKRLGLKREQGVVVTAVQPGSAAYTAGIRAGDVIISAGQKSIENVQDFNKEITAEALKKGLRLVVVTKGFERFAFLKSAPER